MATSVKRLVHALAIAGASFAVTAVEARGAPMVPENGSQVLERVPSRSSPQQKAIARAREALSRNRNDLGAATGLAQLYIQAARIDGDPRYLGYAQASLAPWWGQDVAPPPVRMLRAIILQSNHRFREALADINALLQAEPSNGQAWLTRATIMTVLGEYDGARRACAHLHRAAGALVTQACLSNVGSLSGSATQSYRALAQAFQRGGASVEIEDWVLTLLAEMAARLGEHATSEQHFKAAMEKAPPDAYLLGAYADFLLERNRANEVATLLEDKNRNDALLLRHTLALKALRHPRAAQQTEMLRQRFAAAAMRNDIVHQRERARFELHLLGDPGRALATARANWEVQKEPADLKILVEAARAANDRPSLAQARTWMRDNHYEDRALSDMLAPAFALPGEQKP